MKVLYFSLSLLLVILIQGCNAHKTEAELLNERKIEAVHESWTLVKGHLKSPDSASFPEADTTQVTIKGDIYKVESYVDAVNPFNVRIRTYYRAALCYQSDSTWRQVSLEVK